MVEQDRPTNLPKFMLITQQIQRGGEGILSIRIPSWGWLTRNCRSISWVRYGALGSGPRLTTAQYIADPMTILRRLSDSNIGRKRHESHWRMRRGRLVGRALDEVPCCTYVVFE